MINEKWDYSPKDLPWWAQPRAPQPPEPLTTGVGTPAKLGDLITPILGRILLFRIFVAAMLLLTIWIGGRLADAQNLATIIVGSCLAGFILGILDYLRRVLVRSAAADAGAFRPNKLPPIPSLWRIVLPPLVAPLMIIGAIFVHALLANRFIGLTLLVPSTLAAFYLSGAPPIRFMRQKYMADFRSDKSVAEALKGLQVRPDVIKLATFLLVAWLVPAFTSNTFGLIAVLGLCAFEAKRSFQQLVGLNQWSFFLFGVWRSGARLTREYLDYQQLEENNWCPEETLENRQYRVAALLTLLDVTLLVSLAYYVPWEPFAALFVPEFRGNALFVPEAAMTDYPPFVVELFMVARLTGDPRSGQRPAAAVTSELTPYAELGDFFVFQIGMPSSELQGAPDGGARFPVNALLAGRTFAKFHLDIGFGDPISATPEELVGQDFLGFAGVAPAKALAIPKAQQFAEKLHAYTLPWTDRPNTRTKDLVDLVLFVTIDPPPTSEILAAVEATFRLRNTHPVPDELPPPPEAWREAFAEMAKEAQLQVANLDDGYALVATFWIEISKSGR